MGMKEQFGGIYKGRRVLVTGCTGFKGSWLTLWLKELGAEVYGFALNPPTTPNHWTLISDELRNDRWRVEDVYWWPSVRSVFERFKPEIVFHLAANAIVKSTFEDPFGTFKTNAMGTCNILEACRTFSSVKAAVIITSDKVYENHEWPWGYRENDELGGHTPYDASKVCAEHIIDCYRENFFPMVATARAGNVIGGGDWGAYRLIPDIMRATGEGKEVEIHTPNATRPWQHVLEPLRGYLRLGEELLRGNRDVARAFNFGPGPNEGMTVLKVIETAQQVWSKIHYQIKPEVTHPNEAYLLKIDSTLARRFLGWEAVLSMGGAIGLTVRWYQKYYESGEVISKEQLYQYCDWI